MKNDIESFRGEVPRLTPRALPPNAAQVAMNAKLVSGDLEAWRQFVQEKVLANSAPVRTIFLLKDKWLSWNEQVDVARGVIPGDDTFRAYITAPALYDTPRFTNYALATTGSEPYPVATRPLGVPPPDTEPSVAVDVTAISQSNIALTNPGAEVGTTTGWTVTSGSLVVYNNGDIVGLNAQAGTRFFGSGAVAATVAYQEVDLVAEGVITGQGLRLEWYQATGAAGSTATMSIEFYDSTSTLISTSTLEELAPSPANTWLRRELTVQTPSGAETARIVQTYTRVGAGPALDAYIDAIALNSVEYTNYFDCSTLTGWSVSTDIGTPGASDQWRDVIVDSGTGWGSPSFRLRGDELTPYIHRDFSTENSPLVTLTFDFLQSVEPGLGMHVVLFGDDAGRGSSVLLGPAGVAIHRGSSWDDGGPRVETLTGSLPAETLYTVTLTAEKIDATQARVTINVVDSLGTQIVTDQRATITIDGPRIGFKGATGSLEGRWWYDNIYVTVAAPRTAETVESTATSYVYRFVNDLGEASAPSLASQTVIRPEGGSVVVTTPTAIPSGVSSEYGIVSKQIFRSVSAAGGAVFIFVAEIPLAQADYVDAFDDSQLAGNDELDSEEWDLPPDDLEGILALPNGIMVGFRRNQLCFSAQNRPHAWPLRYRLPTDTDIVAIRNIDTSVIVTTKAFLYTASGTTPDSYTMSQPGAQQAGSSKTGIANLIGGVAFASPDGAMLAAGPTQVTNLTAALFTKEQWEALHPESMTFAVYDDVLHIFYDPLYAPGGVPGCYLIDAKPNGFGVVRMSYHATAAFTDPATDRLYLVLDDIDEPGATYLPDASTAPVPTGRTIFQFDASSSSKLVFRWRGKLNLLPYPLCFLMAMVKASDFDNLVLRLYADGVLLIEDVLTSQDEFTLPMIDDYREFEVEFVGTSRVRTFQAVEDIGEFG